MFNAFGNATEVPAAHWRAEPQTRGTWNILSTCLFTLLLCLWTALHLNIPGHKEGFWRPKLRKTGWLILGLLTPEMGVFTAWYQYLAAHKLNSVISTASTRRHPWTTIHSYYVLMGGFVFDTSDAEVNFLPNNRERLTLTPAGLRYILENEPGILPDISWESIYDKSKANSLAKSLVCIQALWFCVQCIIRLGQGFAISLLELNVFGHAFCALIMYIIWWDKPLDIEEPTLISGSVADEICALMCMRSSSDRSISPFVARPLELPYGVKYGDQWWQNIVNEAENSDRNLLQSVIVSPFFWLSFIVGHFIYGGMHLLAWNAPFPSHTSKVLWLSSGTLVASAGIFWSSAFALIFVIIIVMNVARTLLHLDRASRKTNSKFRNIIITSLISISTIFLYTVFLPAYLLARGYLVVESFIQLAHLPESAYMIPKWSQYFPHFS
ncbi:hypothetical protein DL98DRAFT_644167 [Cadophora sp. DSE1049]|nr:hypothetical protein DL98DRAFT_644167 [Cadophora sp. DSE1049]